VVANVTNETTVAGSTVEQVGFKSEVTFEIPIPADCAGKLQTSNVIVFAQKDQLTNTASVKQKYTDGSLGNCADDSMMPAGQTMCVSHVVETMAVTDTNYEYKESNGYNTLTSSGTCARRLSVNRRLTTTSVTQKDAVLLKYVKAPSVAAPQIATDVDTQVSTDMALGDAAKKTAFSARVAKVVTAFKTGSAGIALPPSVNKDKILSGKAKTQSASAVTLKPSVEAATSSSNMTVSSITVASGVAVVASTSSGMSSRHSAGVIAFLIATTLAVLW